MLGTLVVPALPSLSLPTGGGSISSIGETFQPSVFDGTGSFSVPIPLAPGRNGFGPSLSLRYSSGNGNGIFGLGWDVAIPSITCKTEKGLPRYNSADVYVLSGSEDLVAVPGSQRVSGGFAVEGFRPRVEGLFARIEQWTAIAGGPPHWRVTTKDNVTSLYGRTAQARISDPHDRARVFQWLLQETFDSKGNHILYEYAIEDAADSQRYPRRIYYGNLPDRIETSTGVAVTNSDGSAIGVSRAGSDPSHPAATVSRRYAFEVVFDFGEWSTSVDTAAEEIPNGGYRAPAPVGVDESLVAAPIRPDSFSRFRAGFEVRVARRCQRILCYHHLRDHDGQLLVKATNLSYRNDPHTRLSQLTAITVAGYRRRTPSSARLVQRTLPSISFQYTSFRPREQRFTAIEARGGDGPPAGLQHPEFALVDLFGDGMPDVLHASGLAYRYWRNRGDGMLDAPRLLPTAPAGLSLAHPGVGFGDVDGDGRVELLVQSGSLHGFFKSTSEGGWDSFRPTREAPSIEAGDRRARQIDLTGDGLPDVLVTDDHHFRWFQCLGEDGYREQRAIERLRDLDAFPDITFDDPSGRVRIADMNGDGLADIVLIHHGAVQYWPNLGYGGFGARVTMGAVPDAPALDAAFDPARLFFVDLDGSGCADLVYVGINDVAFWFNQCGNAWSERQVIPGTPFAPTGSGLAFADVFGTGTATLLWSRDAGAIAGANYFALDFCGGVKPHLLTEVDNQCGAMTRLTYAPSTRFALEDAAAGRPWHTTLPFPVHVVSRVETIDRISRSRHTTTYRYRHGYFDGREREFRGFGCVEQEDSQSFSDFSAGTIDGVAPLNADAAMHVPPALTRTWFHTGAWIESATLADRFRAEYWQGDGGAFVLDDHDVPDEPAAMRALRGVALRTEVYASGANPILVNENRYRVRALQSGGGTAVHLTSKADAITWHYERNTSDPRVVHEISGVPDAFGNLTDRISIAYARRTPDPRIPSQATAAVVCTKTDYANAASPTGVWLPALAVQSRVFEITGVVAGRSDGRFEERDFAPVIADLGTPFAPGLWKAVHEKPPVATPAKRLIAWTRTYFQADAAPARLPLGAVESRALLYETLEAALTDGLVARTYGGRVDDALLTRAGYRRESDVTNHWWMPSIRATYDTSRFCLPVAIHAPSGGTTTFTYDAYALLRESSLDAVGNRVQAVNDYRVLAPSEITSPNGHLAAAAYDALGRVAGTATTSASGEGDSLIGFNADPSDAEFTAFVAAPRVEGARLLARASSRFLYDMHARTRRGTPIMKAAIGRERHASVDPHSPIVVSVEYFDGFGRDVQKKVQAEPDPATGAARWTTSGWKVYDNKGNVVRRFEPFFSPTHAFEFDVRNGVSDIVFFDALGRTVGTLHPNRSWSKIVFDAWSETTHDAHDTALLAPLTDPHVGTYFTGLPASTYTPSWHASRIGSSTPAEVDAAQKAALHAATPQVLHFDVLSRPVLAVADAGGGVHLETRTSFDVNGDIVRLIDARGIVASEHVFDMARRQLATISTDAGHSRVLPDVSGGQIASWDANGHASFVKHDLLHRPTERWVRKGSGAYRLLQVTMFGEAAGAGAAAANLAGEQWKVFDSAGLVRHDAFDFKGNPLRQTRILSLDARRDTEWGVTADPWSHLFDEAAAMALLDGAHAYVTTHEYDALNRAFRTITPDQSVQEFTFNEACLPNRVAVRHRGGPSLVMIRNIDYDAKGRRARVEYGNGVATECEFDPETFRLARLRTRKPAGPRRTLQDLHYTYDAIGNITRINDGAQGRVVFANQTVEPITAYRYDALYRLTEASGREHVSLGACRHRDGGHHTVFIPLRADGQTIANAAALSNYTQHYRYDDAGNLTEIRHARGAVTLWTRTQTFDSASNRIRRSGGGCAGEALNVPHDGNGNVLRLPHIPSLEWNDRNQLVRMELTAAAAPDDTVCRYDSEGRRVRKLTTGLNGSRVEERIYLAGCELFLVKDGSGAIERWETLHVSDGESRMAIIETRTAPANPAVTQETLVRLQFGNHLGTVALETDFSPQARLISYEEFTPYGETTYLAGANQTEVVRKRYRYSAKERDRESGLCYYGARYLAPWMGRWMSADPAGLVDGPNLFAYVSNNPVGFRDARGTSAEHRPVVTNQVPFDPNNPTTTGVQIEGYVKSFRTALVNVPGYGRAAQVITEFLPIGKTAAQLSPGEIPWYASEVTKDGVFLGTGSTNRVVNTPGNLGGNQLLENVRGEHFEYMQKRNFTPKSMVLPLVHGESGATVLQKGVAAFLDTDIGKKTQASLKRIGVAINAASLKATSSGKIVSTIEAIKPASTPSGPTLKGIGAQMALGYAWARLREVPKSRVSSLWLEQNPTDDDIAFMEHQGYKRVAASRENGNFATWSYEPGYMRRLTDAVYDLFTMESTLRRATREPSLQIT